MESQRIKRGHQTFRRHATGVGAGVVAGGLGAAPLPTPEEVERQQGYVKAPDMATGGRVDQGPQVGTLARHLIPGFAEGGRVGAEEPLDILRWLFEGRAGPVRSNNPHSVDVETNSRERIPTDEVGREKLSEILAEDPLNPGGWLFEGGYEPVKSNTPYALDVEKYGSDAVKQASEWGVRPEDLGDLERYRDLVKYMGPHLGLAAGRALDVTDMFTGSATADLPPETPAWVVPLVALTDTMQYLMGGGVTTKMAKPALKQLVAPALKYLPSPKTVNLAGTGALGALAGGAKARGERSDEPRPDWLPPPWAWPQPE
jgi:hypothetical protein